MSVICLALPSYWQLPLMYAHIWDIKLAYSSIGINCNVL